MSDPTELVLIGGGGISVGAIVVALLKWSGSRNISTLDDTIKDLNKSVQELSLEVRGLREKDIGHERDSKELRTQCEVLAQRLEGLGKYWREQFEEQRRVTHARLEKATLDLLQAIDAVASANEQHQGKKR